MCSRDRFRTMVNVMGDALATGIMAHICRKDFVKEGEEVWRVCFPGMFCDLFSYSAVQGEKKPVQSNILQNLITSDRMSTPIANGGYSI